MEDVVELGPAVDEVVEDLLAGLAEVLDEPVEELGVPDLVLDLGGHGELAVQARGPQDPVAFGKRAHDLGVGVHLDELNEPLPVLVRHPVAGLDLVPFPDPLLERLDFFLVRHASLP